MDRPMQVSWIDSDQIAPFLTALRNDAPPKPADVAWEWHTLPDPKPGTKSPVAEGEGGGDFMAEVTASEVPPSAEPIFAPDLGMPSPSARELEAPRPPGPELDLIRSRLQSIKERAIAAGMLRRQLAPPLDTMPVETVAYEVPATDPVPPPTPAEETPISSATPEVEAAPATEPESPAEARTVSESLAEAFSALPPHAPERTIAPQFSPFAVVEPAPAPEFETPLPQPQVAGEEVREFSDEDYYFEVPLGTISERLDAFAQWSMRWLGTDQLVVVDEHGDLVWGTDARASLVLSAMMAWTAALRATALSACDMPTVIHRELSTGEMLAVIPCRTRVGDLQIAVMRSVGLAGTEAGLLRQALEAALDVGPPPDRSPKSEVQ